MPKVHADTETALVIEFSERPCEGTFYLSGNATTGEQKERHKNARLKEFEQLINRHIAPHFNGEYRTYEIHKREQVCSGCGSHWTEKSETYNGGCCADDEKNNPETPAQPVAQSANSGA